MDITNQVESALQLAGSALNSVLNGEGPINMSEVETAYMKVVYMLQDMEFEKLKHEYMEGFIWGEQAVRNRVWQSGEMEQKMKEKTINIFALTILKARRKLTANYRDKPEYLFISFKDGFLDGFKAEVKKMLDEYRAS